MGSKGKNKDNGRGDEQKIITDPRFAAAHTDPRFRNVRKRKTKVEIDSRFKQMFSDPNFASSKTPFDKRGKPKNSKEQKNSLERYYELEEDEKPKDEEQMRKEDNASRTSSEDDDEKDEVEENDKLELASESDSELESDDSGAEVDYSTDDTDVDLEEEEEEDGDNALEENVPQIEKETHRLAVMNLDWRHVKAVDLYVTLSSFLPQNGQILSVSVYPSEFGLQRMKEEEVHGPVGLFDDESESDDEDGDDEVDNEKLRQYELSRLKYYYAVVECDSSATADHLYKSCDGVEYERSANVLDLRFIPDSTEFKHAPRDVATEAPANYKGLDFETRALQQSKVHLSWDEDEPDRIKTLNRKFTEDQLAELELKEFLASDESESDDDNENTGEEEQREKRLEKQDKYRALLQSGDGSDEENEEGGDMEVTFNTGLDGLSKRILDKKDKKSESVWQAYLRKKREKKKSLKNKSKNSSDDDSSDSDQEPPEQPDDFFIEEPRVKKSKKGKNVKQAEDLDEEAEASKAELELLLADDNGDDDGPKGYKIKPKKAKGKKGKEVLGENKIPTADFEDSRFSSFFTSPLFALDPTNPQFKRSAAYARQLTQRQHDQKELVERGPSKAARKAHFPSEEPKINSSESQTLPSKNEKYELSSLVRSIKAKSQQLPKSIETDEILPQPRDKRKQHEDSSLVKSTKKKKTKK